MDWQQQYIIDSNGMIRWEAAMRVTDDDLLQGMTRVRLVHDLACSFAFMGVRTGVC